MLRLFFILSIVIHSLNASYSSRYNTQTCTEITKSIDIRVINRYDDAEERVSNGDMYIDSSDLELTEDGHEQIVGIRFRSINIPQGATITNAYIQFQVDESSSTNTNLHIYGEDTDNSSYFSNRNHNISSRDRTDVSMMGFSNDYILWSPDSWDNVGEQGEKQRTPDLQKIVQKIVDRSGWSSGNAMSFIITGSGKRVAESFDGDSSASPLLHIEYIACQEDEVENNDTTNQNSTAICYALTDNSDKLYKVSMIPNGNPLPIATSISISTDFNGEGSAYRASDNKFYAFKAQGDDRGPSDLYTIDITTGATTKIVDDIISGTVDGAEFYYDPTLQKEILYIISGETNSKLYAFEPDNWTLLDGYPKNTNTNLSSLAIDPFSGDAYAIDDYNYDGNEPKVYKLNLKTGSTTHITTLQHLADAEGLAFASDGNLYIEDEGRDDLIGKRLYMVNKETGELIPSAITDAIGDIEGLSCNGTQIAIDYPTIKIDTNSSIVEGNSSVSNLDFLVTLSKPAIKDVTFTYSVNSISANLGEDYTLDSNLTKVIPQGESSTIIRVYIKGDIEVEDNEQFSIGIVEAKNAVVDNSLMIGTIINDDRDDADLVAEYRFDECPLDLMGELDDHTPHRYRHRVRNGFRTSGDIAKINRSGAFHREYHQYTESEDGLDNVFGTSSNEFSITTWIYPTSLTTTKTNHNTANTFFAKASDYKNDNIEIGVNDNGTLHLYLDTLFKDKYADFGNAGDITLNSWHFIGVSYKDGVVIVQIDDKTYINDTTWSGATNLDQGVGSPISIGASLHIKNYFDGYIDEFKIFRNRLSATTMNRFRQREENGKNWDNTTREVASECSGASPLGCIMSAFMFQNKPTDINTLNLVNGEMTTAVEDISQDNINAVGFNKKDGYFWGYNYTKHDGTLARIGMNSSGKWVSEDFKVEGLDGFASYVGDIDNNGHIYLKEGGFSKKVVVIDLDPNSSNYLKKIREFNLDFSFKTADWGFNPKDNMLYAVNGGSAGKYLYKIDPSNGHLISQENTMLTGDRVFGASFFDANGFYYVYDNSSGDIYRIDVANSPQAVLFANANIVTFNDGAMCTDAEFKFDFGDLPDNYPSKLESNGARHSLPVYGDPSVYLGVGINGEDNAKPSLNANLDEFDDGVRINNTTLQDVTINAGSTINLKVTTHGDGFLNAWIDWNGDGDFNDENEQIAHNIDGSNGLINLNIAVPSSAIDQVTYARFRYSYQQDLQPTGSAIDGEVEDYKINIHGNLEPFSCNDDNRLYMSNRTELGVGSGDSGATWLHTFTPITPVFTPIGNGFTSSNGGYNAIGYNVNDNFIYALYGNELLKIDKNANIKNLGAVSGLPDTQLYAGEFDKDGYYYVSGDGSSDNKMYKIDITQKKVIQTITLSESVKFWDMAIDTTGEYFYAMVVTDNADSFKNDRFVKINKNSGEITTIEDDYNNITSYISLVFSDRDGKIIAISNDNGMYEIIPATGKAYWINETPQLSYYNDGTSCPNAKFTLPPRIPRLSISDVSKAEGDSGESNFAFKVSIDADLPFMPVGLPAIFYYKVIDGDGNDVTPPHEVATQSDHDFKGGDGISINMDIFSNTRETYINVPVYGDTKVEADEEFYVEIYFPQMFPNNFCILGKSRGVGTILNDDIKFKVIRTNGDKNNDSLYTQIAGRDFDYSIISDTPNNIQDMTLKVELIDNTTENVLYRGYKYIQDSAKVDIVDTNDLAILQATKDASFKIAFLKDENGTIAHGNYATQEAYTSLIDQGYTEFTQSDVGDHFAIRPAGYIVSIGDIDENNQSVVYRDSTYSGSTPLNLLAGYNYKIEAKAIANDINSSKTTGYISSDINATLVFNDKSTCSDTSNGNLDGYSFDRGELSNNISHDNVGKYILKLQDNSWSDIDKSNGDCIPNSSAISANGNEKSGCSISTNAIDKYKQIEMKFHPYYFDMSNAKVENIPNSSKDFVYMNDLSQNLNMALNIKTDIIARSKNDIRATNFTNSCEAEDLVLSLDYKITTDTLTNRPTYSSIKTIKGTELTFKRVVSYNNTTPNINEVSETHLDNNITIGADKFLDINDGNSSVDIRVNIVKSLSEPINPIKIQFEKLEAYSPDSKGLLKNKIYHSKGEGYLNSTKKFYFASVAPDVENYPDEYDRYCVTPISVLIFCDQNTTWCTDMIGSNGLNNIKTQLGWYTSILHDSNKDGKVLGFSVDNLLAVVTPQANNLPNFNEDTPGKILKLTTGYGGNTFPTKVQVDMDLSPWLKYHRDPNRNGIPFWRNTFRDRNTTWSGIGGESFRQIEIKTTTRPAKKISW